MVSVCVCDRLVQAYEMLRSLGGDLLCDNAKRAVVNQAVEHLKELKAAATVREETVQGILDSMVQDLRREEAPERCFCKELGFSLANLRIIVGKSGFQIELSLLLISSVFSEA